VGVITPMQIVNPIKLLSVLKIKPKDIIWRKLWRKFLRSNLCLENWRIYSKRHFIGLAPGSKTQKHLLIKSLALSQILRSSH
jgi:hypothetical protein